MHNTTPTHRTPHRPVRRTQRLLRSMVTVIAVTAVAVFSAATMAANDRDDLWLPSEAALLLSLAIDRLPAPQPDPSNAVESQALAQDLGRRLFADKRLSQTGTVSCASCHLPEQQFQDGLPVGRGVGTGSRRTMPAVAAAHSPWLFWDGRKDSLWAQALGPLEDAAEHGSNRTQLAKLLKAHYQADYETLFGPMPPLSDLASDAGPLAGPSERAAWATLPPARRVEINRVFANLGKAIAAYEKTLSYGESRFDHYVRAVGSRDAAGLQALNAQEVRGLRLFIGKGQCATCHNGPLLTDQHFHNTGVPPRDATRPDQGRLAATPKVLADEFNCLGPYSDAAPQACQELRFIATNDPALDGAFKTPSLRNVALRPPYMHAGQFATLDQVIGHYARSPVAAIGRSELHRGGLAHGERQPIRLNDQERRDLASFLAALSGPIIEMRSP